MLNSIDRYLLRRLLATFLPVVLGSSLLLFVGGTFRLVKDEDLSLGQIVLALPWVLPYLLPALLPLAYVVTLSLVLGRMVADNEVIAFNVLGVPPRALYRPCLILGAALSVCALLLNVSLVPLSHNRRKEAGAATYLQLTGVGSGQHLSRRFDTQGLSVYVRRYGADGLHGVVLRVDTFWGGNAEENRRTFLVTASRGHLEALPHGNGLLMVLEGVDLTVEGGPLQEPVRVHLERFVEPLSLGGWRRVKVSDYSSAQVRGIIENQHWLDVFAGAVGGFPAAGRARWAFRRYAAREELHNRIGLSLAPLVLACFVPPLTVLLRARNALIPFGAALGSCSLLFFAPSLLGETLAETFSQPLCVYIGCTLTGSAALVVAWLAGRR